MHILSFAHHIPEQQKVSRLHHFFQSSLLFSFLASDYLINILLQYYTFFLFYTILYQTLLYYTTLHFYLYYVLYYIRLYYISYYTTLYYTLTMIFYTIEMYRVYIIWFFSDKRRTNVYRRWTWAGTSCVVKGQSVCWRLWRWVVGPRKTSAVYQVQDHLLFFF